MRQYLIQNAFTGKVFDAPAAEARFWASIDLGVAYNVYGENGTFCLPMNAAEIR